jgi:hypothetical protein
MKLTTTQPTYHRPRFIPELDQEGLDSADIAMALGARPNHVTEKLKRIDISLWNSMGWNLAVSTAKSGKKGRPRIVWYLNTRAAKAFVARWENDRGNGYLNFLFACEQAAIEEVPRLKTRILTLEARLAPFEDPLPNNVKRLPKKSTVDVPVGYVIQPTLGSIFGDELVIPRLVKIAKDKLTPQEQRKAKGYHLTKVAEGAMRAKRKIENLEMIENLPPLFRPETAAKH